MAFVRVEQRNAHLAGAVRLITVEGRDGPVSKALLTAISNTRKGSGENRGGNRGEEATAIQWTLWGKQAEAAAQYLGKGSHVNVVGRVQNNNYERDGETVYTMAFTAEEIDYLDTKAEGEALRGAGSSAKMANSAGEVTRSSAGAGSTKAPRNRKAAAHASADQDTDDLTF
jgi:single-strand DNA-binding protein